MECVVDTLCEQIISERKDGKSIAEIAEICMQGMLIPKIAELLGKDK